MRSPFIVKPQQNAAEPFTIHQRRSGWLPPWPSPSASPWPTARASPNPVVLDTVKISASADASATGLTKTLSGGQVARGGRIGILGTRDQMETPFSVTAYTNQLIQDQQAQSVADVLQNDPSIRMARGFGNFQEP